MARTLLAIFAHPDDETFGPGGTLARYAAAGAAVHLICATRGEAGESDLADLGDCEDLACRREKELRCAAGILGLELMRRLRPQVVLTFDAYGGYGHPDHIAMHNAAVAAFERLPEDERPQKLYFTVFPRTTLRWAVRVMPLFGVDPAAVGKNRDINLRAALEHELPITTRIDVSATYEVKLQAAACHSSQSSGPGSFWGRLPRWLVRRWQATETFYRARPAFQPGERVERDLFAEVTSGATHL
jgi:LmbE family N-acetylglucosaminyl deacetylase